MLKITDTSGSVQATIPPEIATTVGVWRDMITAEHSKDEDDAVHQRTQELLTFRYAWMTTQRL
jgi:hypothetical protein